MGQSDFDFVDGQFVLVGGPLAQLRPILAKGDIEGEARLYEGTGSSSRRELLDATTKLHTALQATLLPEGMHSPVSSSSGEEVSEAVLIDGSALFDELERSRAACEPLPVALATVAPAVGDASNEHSSVALPVPPPPLPVPLPPPSGTAAPGPRCRRSGCTGRPSSWPGG